MKNFSLLLACRYLNPVRTHVSVITLISLLGVATGVMVLVVTLSVMNGFEGLLKNIVLSSSPNIELKHGSARFSDITPAPRKEWEPLKEQLEQHPDVAAVSSSISDYVITEHAKHLQPTLMKSVDIHSDVEIQKIQNQIEDGNGSAEALSYGDSAVISSNLSQIMRLEIGDKVLMHSSANLKKIKPVYDRLELDLVVVREAETFKNIQKDLLNEENWKKQGEQEVVNYTFALDVNNYIGALSEDTNSQRSAEITLLNDILDYLADTTERDKEKDILIYEVGTRQAILDSIDELGKIDKKAADDEDLRGLRELILPKELEIVGIYQTNRFARSTDIFIPMTVAQDLVDIGDGLTSLSVTLHEPDNAAVVRETLLKDFPSIINDDARRADTWLPITWMESSKEHFQIIAMQKFMMIFVLSFIVLIAVFSIAAVMFTVAIQKKKEIGVMKALGATPAQIVLVFGFQGVIVGFIGSLIGIGVGYLVVLNVSSIQTFMREVLRFNPFPKSLYGTDTLPTEIIAKEFVIVAVGALVLCTIASLIPAWSASRSDAARSLRNL